MQFRLGFIFNRQPELKMAVHPCIAGRLEFFSRLEWKSSALFRFVWVEKETTA